MASPDGPHARNAKPGAVYRGSKKRVAHLAPFEELPANFWFVMAIGVLMFGLSALLIYGSL
jgi:hypothetical protein